MEGTTITKMVVIPTMTPAMPQQRAILEALSAAFWLPLFQSDLTCRYMGIGVLMVNCIVLWVDYVAMI